MPTRYSICNDYCDFSSVTTRGVQVDHFFGSGNFNFFRSSTRKYSSIRTLSGTRNFRVLERLRAL